MEQWFVLDQSSETPVPTGPYTRERIEAMVAAGAVRADTRVALAGTQHWIEASADPLLAALFRAVPPMSPEGVAAPAVAADLGGYSFSAALTLAWKSFTTRWSKWFTLSIVWFVIAMLLAVPQWMSQFAGTAAGRSDDAGARAVAAAIVGIGGCFGLLLQVLVGLPLFAGLVYAAAEIHEGRGRLEDLFQGFRRYGTALLGGLLFAGIYFACAVAAAVPLGISIAVMAALSRGPAGAGVAFFIGIAVMICALLALMALVMLRVIHAPVIAIDPRFGNPGVLEAFRMSWRNTAGCGLSMLALIMLAGLIAGLSVLLLCVGYVLVGIPLLASVMGAMYVLAQRSRLGVPPAP